MSISKKHLGSLIKLARQQKADQYGTKFNQADLARLVGKSRSYVGDLESGRTYPSFPLLTAISHACEVPLSFFEMDETTLENNQLNSQQNIRSTSTSFPLPIPPVISPDSFLSVPILGEISGGLPLYADQNIEGYMLVDRSQIRMGKFDEVFYLKVRGDSMIPKYQPGDLVLIRRQPIVEEGEIAAALVESETATLKKVYHQDDYIFLHSTNPAYPVQKYPAQDIEIIGKAIFRSGPA